MDNDTRTIHQHHHHNNDSDDGGDGDLNLASELLSMDHKLEKCIILMN